MHILIVGDDFVGVYMHENLPIVLLTCVQLIIC